MWRRFQAGLSRVVDVLRNSSIIWTRIIIFAGVKFDHYNTGLIISVRPKFTSLLIIRAKNLVLITIGLFIRSKFGSVWLS